VVTYDPVSQNLKAQANATTDLVKQLETDIQQAQALLQSLQTRLVAANDVQVELQQQITDRETTVLYVKSTLSCLTHSDSLPNATEKLGSKRHKSFVLPRRLLMNLVL